MKIIKVIKGKKVNIYEELLEDHKNLAKLLNEIKKLIDIDFRYYNDKIKILYKETHYQILSHIQREEKVFYNRLMKNKSLSNFIHHIQEDHFIIELLLKELYSINNIDKIWAKKFNRLYWILSAHAELEEGQIFKVAKKILSEKEAKRLGEHVFNLKYNKL